MAQIQIFETENLVFSWDLPGHGDPYYNCGDFYSKGCLNSRDHPDDLAFIKRMVSTCLRAVCPVCYQKWAGKQAHAIAYRLDQARRGNAKEIHVQISLPRSDYFLVEDDYSKLRRKIYSLLKKSGFWGGSCIFHPFRLNKSIKKWYFSPHFHIIGYGWIRGKKVKAIYEKTGYIIKNLGVRKSVVATAQYQLSHAGIKSGTHTITWFGSVAYNKIKIIPEVVEPEVCPECGNRLIRVAYVGDGEDPLGERPEGEYWIEPGGWAYMTHGRGGY